MSRYRNAQARIEMLEADLRVAKLSRDYFQDLAQVRKNELLRKDVTVHELREKNKMLTSAFYGRAPEYSPVSGYVFSNAFPGRLTQPPAKPAKPKLSNAERREARREALKLALTHGADGHAEVLKAAQEYYKFLTK